MPDLETQPEIQTTPDQTPPVPATPEVQTGNQSPTSVEPALPTEKNQTATTVISSEVQPVEVPTEAKSALGIAPVETAQSQKPNKLIELLIKAKEKIQFRKRVKLGKIIGLVRAKGKITNNDVQKLLRVSDATATRYLAELVREGQLKRVGPAKQPFYQLNQ